MNKYLIIDGMLNGTGIRNQVEGGYLQPESLGISTAMTEKLNSWLKKYEKEHYSGYINRRLIRELDTEGIEIAKAIATELNDCKISYFSDATLTKYEL